MRHLSRLVLGAISLMAATCAEDTTLEPNGSPDIDVAPSTLSMSARTGSYATAASTVWNVGDAALSVTSITSSETWLSASPSNFTVSAGMSGIVTLTAAATSLNAGTYDGTLAIASDDPDEATTTVNVTFTVIR